MRYRLTAVLLAMAIVVAFAAPAAAKTVSTTTLDLTLTRDVDQYKMILSVDPMGNYREKTGNETYWFTAVDNGKVRVLIDPIFVVGN
jgi:hypothetical protein